MSSVRRSVCLSVTLAHGLCHCDHIGWKSWKLNAQATRGVATGVDIGIYTPPKKKKSAKVNFLWGKNDVRTAIQQFYPPPKTFIPPKQKPFKNFGKSSRGRSQGYRVPKIFRASIRGPLPGHLCDSTAFLYEHRNCFRRISYIHVIFSFSTSVKLISKNSSL